MTLSAFFCGYVTTNVLGGYLADRHGGDIIMCYSAIAWSALTVLLPMLSTSQWIADSTTTVLLIRFLTGVSQGVFFPSFTAILTKHVAVAERGFVYSFAFSGSSAGTIITGFSGSILISHCGWSCVFTLVGLLSFCWVLWLRWLISATKIRSVATSFKESETKVEEPVPWMKLASQPPFWGLFIAYFTANYCFYNVLAWIPVYFQDMFPESKVKQC